MNAKSFFVRLVHFVYIIYNDEWEIFFFFERFFSS